MNETIATGLHQPDGPVALSDGRLALVETEANSGSVVIVASGASKREVCKIGGRPAGLAVDGSGCFWVAGGPDNSILRVSPEGEILKVVVSAKENPFLLPRHLAFGPDGLLYMSDSGVSLSDLVDGSNIRPDFLDASYNGRIYQIDPHQGRVLRTLATGLLLATGIAFDAEGLLYYSEMLTGTIYRQVIGGRPEVFAHVPRSAMAETLNGPAGLAFDNSGTLYAAIYGQGDLCLISPAGKIGGHIPTNGRLPASVAFSCSGKYALIAEQEHGAIERIPMRHPGGLKLHRPAI
jgi:gluconolactonase